MPAWDQTGTPDGLLGFTHLRSSTMSGSASWIMRRTSARILARQSPTERMRSSIRRGAEFPAARLASAAGLAFAPALGGQLDLLPALAAFPAVAVLRGLLARDMPLAFGFALLFVIIREIFVRCFSSRF